MGRVTVDDVRKWTELIAVVMPAGVQVATLAVEGVASAIKAIKGLRGEPATPEDPDELLLAGQVVAMLTAAQAPWKRIRDRANSELERLQGQG